MSLSEVDAAIRDVMALDSLYTAKPVLMRAFQAAKDTHRAKGGERMKAAVQKDGKCTPF